jgi:tRNA-Thr(GGU) m(6)t(6)A37 methyltransferase TsaA
MTRATFEPIGVVRSTHAALDHAPSQASEAPAAAGTASVVVDERFVDGLLGLDRYPYVWLVTWLHDQPADRPLRLVPRATELTGEVQGVFASRAPVRPNAIGLSLVRQLGVDGNVITVGGVDLVDGTPVLDIKPWFAGCDRPDALS